MTKICLNMIVKNESAIITRLFDSVLPLIDSYCICDTGSTDNTIEIINNYFENKKIEGKIVELPFEDFSHNRNYALDQCLNMSNADYILLLDADMVLKINEKFNIVNFKNFIVNYDVHYLFQGNENIFYKNIRIVRNDGNYKYIGTTHEYLQIKKETKYSHIKEYDIFVQDIGDGGCKDNKLKRDLELLSKSLNSEPENERSLFYLANTYKDLKMYKEAIETYKKRIELQGWSEELWYSHYSIGNCYQELKDYSNAILYYIDAIQYSPSRIENIYKLVEYYRLKKHYHIAYEFFKLGYEKKRTITNFDLLFLEKDVYNFKLDYEYSIIGYYINNNNFNNIKCCFDLFNKKIPNTIFKNVLSNYKFYAPVLEGGDFTQSISFPTFHKKGFLSSTPSICMHNNDIFINIRYVNYKIKFDGQYETSNNIESINILTKYDANFKNQGDVMIKYNQTYDNYYKGLEDIRLFSLNHLYFNANRPFTNSSRIEHGIIIGSGNAQSMLLTKENEQTFEKNWVLFESNKKLKCVYGWYPLTIGNIQNNQFVSTHIIKTSDFFKCVRGSSNGVLIDNHIWFLCHVVSDETRRHYYHCFIKIDKDTFQIVDYTCLFTFDKNIVEFSLGFIVYKNHLLIGYSTNDCTTKFKIVSFNAVEKLFLNR